MQTPTLNQGTWMEFIDGEWQPVVARTEPFTGKEMYDWSCDYFDPAEHTFPAYENLSDADHASWEQTAIEVTQIINGEA